MDASITRASTDLLPPLMSPLLVLTPLCVLVTFCDCVVTGPSVDLTATLSRGAVAASCECLPLSPALLLLWLIVACVSLTCLHRAYHRACRSVAVC